MEPNEVVAYLKRVSTFRDLEEEGDQELLRLVPHVSRRTYEPGDVLIREDSVAMHTLIVLQGRVKLTRKLKDSPQETSDGVGRGERVGHTDLGERGIGATLGRTGLDVGDYEQATATALEETTALILPFRDLVRVYQQSRYLREHLEGPLKPDRLVGTLQGIPIFDQLSDRAGQLELYSVAQITHEQVYGNGEWLFRQGEISDRLLLILAGEVQLTAVDQDGIVRDVGTLGPGDQAGTTGLMVGDFHDVTAVARGYARAIYVLRTEFAEMLEARPYLRRRIRLSIEIGQRLRLPTFSWLRDDEWVIDVVQRHWSRLVRQTAALVVVLLFLIPAIIGLLVAGGVASFVIAAALCLPVIALCLGITWQYINWRDDYFVVTTQRVVHIERVGPFSTQQEESPLDNIENIAEVQPSFSANVMRYGNLILQTAGERVDIDMSSIPRPARVRWLISEQIERAKARRILRTRGQIRELLARRLDAGQAEPLPPQVEPEDEQPSGPKFLPAVLVNALWEYFFPASWVETDGGTIMWRRYWLPGMLRHAAPTGVYLLSTLGGIGALAWRWGTQGFLAWFIGWLVVEAIAFGVLLWFVEDWRNDYFQLTQSHVILVERRPLLLQESRLEARLDRIQNLGFEIPNIFARMLNYGHVQFETAGTEGRFELKFVRRPEEIQSTISDRQYAYRQHQNQVEANRRQQEMLTWFATYDDLHQDGGRQATPSV